MLTTEAPTIWNSLRGIICVYKPADVTCNNIRKAIMYKICSELNQMNCRPPIDYVTIEGDSSKHLVVTKRPSYADHPLVVGPRYQPADLPCTWSSYLGTNTSGVLLMGIRDGTKTASNIRVNRLVRSYRVKGLLGQATDNNYKDGKRLKKTTFRSLKIGYMESVLSAMQGAHQRKMFELCGVSLQSQAAYELAVQGPIRPANSEIPLIYGIKCVHFEPPEFTIEVHCINEYEMYLKTLIHEIGIQLHSTAHCCGIQCIRHGYFNLDLALLRKHWKLQEIVTNMEQCRTIINEHPNTIRQQSAALQ